MAKYKIKRHKKSDTIFTKIKNGFITIALSVLMIWGLQAYSTSTGLRFVHLTDIHFMENGINGTFKMMGESSKLLDDAIEQINETPNIDFTMITGDLIDKAYANELEAALTHLEKLNNPWYFAFGNHDRMIGGYLTTSVYMNIIKKSNPNYKFDKSYYAFTPKKGYRVIVLDDIITTEITSQGYIDNTQYQWLKKELDKAKNNTVLIFLHIPVIEPFASPGHRLKNSVAITSLIESYKNPIGVFQGHYHSTKITQHNNVLYVSSPALVSYPNAFRIVNVTNYRDKVVFDFSWAETREKTIQKMGKLLIMVPYIYAGEEKDRSGIYEIKK